jgi:TPP-dependent pyruvate/acetoin dehydrogenase alpha subunit
LCTLGVSEAEITAMDEAARARVDEAVVAARAGTAPEPAAALADVYSPNTAQPPAPADAAA